MFEFEIAMTEGYNVPIEAILEELGIDPAELWED